MRTTVQGLVTLFWSPLKPQRCKTKNEHKHREAFTPATTGAETTADTHIEEPPRSVCRAAVGPWAPCPRELLPRLRRPVPALTRRGATWPGPAPRPAPGERSRVAVLPGCVFGENEEPPPPQPAWNLLEEAADAARPSGGARRALRRLHAAGAGTGSPAPSGTRPLL